MCTGSLVLGAAGLLQGLTATTHWSVYPELQKIGAIPTAQKVVEHLDRRIITATGVSSRIDMALRLSELLVDATAAKAMQLMIEYDPHPPFDCGSMDKAGQGRNRTPNRIRPNQKLRPAGLAALILATVALPLRYP